MNTTLLPNVTNTHHLSLVQIIIFHQTTSICDQNPGQPCSIKAGTLHHLKLINRLRCFGASLIYYKLLALGSSMFSQILCQQIANELEKKLLWTVNSLKCSNFISRNYFLEDLWLGIQKELFLFDCTFRKKNANTCNAQTQLTHRNDKKLSIIYSVSIFFIICWNWALISFLWCFWKDIIVNPFFSQNCHKICYNGVICNLFNCENHFSLFKKFLIEWNMSIISAHCVFCDFKVIAKKV